MDIIISESQYKVIEEFETRPQVFYSFARMPNKNWVTDDNKIYSEEFFDDKDFDEYQFDNFFDMDQMFGHKNSLFGTRGLEVGNPKRTSRSFDMYNSQVGPALVRVLKTVKNIQNKDEIDEYSRTLKNARKQGSGLRFPKSAIKSNPLRFRPYNREMVDETEPKVGTGKKPEGSDRRLYTDENPSDTVSVKFKTKEDIVDTLNKDSFKSKSHKRQSQIINLIHQRVRAAYQNAKDPETKKRLKRGLDYIENEKEKSKEKTIRLQKQEQTEGELTERCWKGYTQKGMKTMFGKRYPNCVKKTK